MRNKHKNKAQRKAQNRSNEMKRLITLSDSEFGATWPPFATIRHLVAHCFDYAFGFQSKLYLLPPAPTLSPSKPFDPRGSKPSTYTHETRAISSPTPPCYTPKQRHIPYKF